MPFTDKVNKWLEYNKFTLNNVPTAAQQQNYTLSSCRQLRSYTAAACDKFNNSLHPMNSSSLVIDEDDDTSVDTTKYIKSNRTKTKTKITSMTIKTYCLQSTGTIPEENRTELLQPSHQQKPASVTKKPEATPNLTKTSTPTNKTKTRLTKKVIVTCAASSSSENDNEIEKLQPRTSRRMLTNKRKLKNSTAGNQKLKDSQIGKQWKRRAKSNKN